MNRELDKHQRDDGTGEDRQYQPARDALVPISQLPNVPGKARHSRNSARGFFLGSLEPLYSGGFYYQLGNSIRIVVFHAADGITGNSHNSLRTRWRGQTGIAVSAKWRCGTSLSDGRSSVIIGGTLCRYGTLRYHLLSCPMLTVPRASAV
jgi:hypothetical protein